MRWNSAAAGPRLCVLMVLGAMGCCSDQFHRFDTITVMADDALRDDVWKNLPTVEVDVIGVNNTDLPLLKEIPINDYFRTQHASSALFVMTLKEGQESQSLQIASAEGKRIWKEWEEKRDFNLVIIADYPPLPAGRADADPRRLILPLTCGAWPGSQTEIKVKVTRLGLSVETPPLPPK